VSKPKSTYHETYRKGVTIREDLLPERFPFTSEGWRVDSIEIKAAGVLDDGREYQDIRIYNREVGS
jgi:hypothetical protein